MKFLIKIVGLLIGVWKVIWVFLKEESAAIQALAGIIGVTLIVIGVLAFILDRKRFNNEYGKQVELVITDNMISLIKSNDLISNIRIEVYSYLQISDKRFEPVNPQYILIDKLFSPELKCIKRDINSECYYDKSSLLPTKKILSVREQLNDLEIVFNHTPRKVFAELICLIQVSFADSKSNYRQEYYASKGCFNGDPIRFTEEQFKQYFEDKEIIGKIDYEKAGPLGFISPYFTNRITRLLAQYRWQERFIESSSLRWYRTMYRYGVPR